MSINIGDKIPEFKLVNTNKETLADVDFLGTKTMFVFFVLSSISKASLVISLSKFFLKLC